MMYSENEVQQSSVELQPSDIINWIENKSEIVTNRLSHFSSLMREPQPTQGTLITGNPGPVFPENLGLENDPDLPNYGEYNGAGICGIGQSILGKALRNAFGDNVQLKIARIFAIKSSANVQKANSISIDDIVSLLQSNNWLLHKLLRFSIDNVNWWTVDTAYTQIDHKHDPYEILIIPSDQENEYYQADTLFNYREELERAVSHNTASKLYVEKTYSFEKELDLWVERVDQGSLGQLTSRDINSLIAELSD